MLRADEVKTAGTWSGPASTASCSTTRLAFAAASPCRAAKAHPSCSTCQRRSCCAAATRLVLEDGRLVEVVAAPEPLAEIRAANPRDMLRLAWHLGNRHLPIALSPNKIRIRRDHVIEDMVRALGAKITKSKAPFDPEGGAYEGHAGRDDGHDARRPRSSGHHHDHDHAIMATGMITTTTTALITTTIIPITMVMARSRPRHD